MWHGSRGDTSVPWAVAPLLTPLLDYTP